MLNTEINENRQIYIDSQHIGELKGLNFLIEITSKTLDTTLNQ